MTMMWVEAKQRVAGWRSDDGAINCPSDKFDEDTQLCTDRFDDFVFMQWSSHE